MIWCEDLTAVSLHHGMFWGAKRPTAVQEQGRGRRGCVDNRLPSQIRCVEKNVKGDVNIFTTPGEYV